MSFGIGIATNFQNVTAMVVFLADDKRTFNFRKNHEDLIERFGFSTWIDLRGL